MIKRKMATMHVLAIGFQLHLLIPKVMNLRELHIIISLVRQDFSLGHNNQQ